MLGLVNTNYEFLMIDVGTNGRVSDGDVIEKTKFYKTLLNNELYFPKASPLPNSTDGNVSYVILADDAFTLSKCIKKPFSNNTLDKEDAYLIIVYLALDVLLKMHLAYLLHILEFFTPL